MRSSIGKGFERTERRHARPGRRQAPEPARFIVVVDAVLPPGVALIDQCELPPAKGMKRMGNPKELRRTDAIACS
jgi:hypothetical protein